MGALTFAGRIILVVLNIVFIMASLALIIAGFVIRWAYSAIKPQVQEILKKIEDTAKTVYSDTNFNTDKFELGSLVSTLCYVCIAIGIVLLAISFIGCCGACCNLTTLMLIYAIILIAILACQVAAVIIAFAKPEVVKHQIKTNLKKTMSDYDGIKGTTISALGWNWAQQEFDCCGAESYKDFEDNSSPYKNAGINDNAPISATNGDVYAPVACCKTLPTTSAERTSCAGNGATPPSDTLSNYNTGCVDALWTKIMDRSSKYFYIAIAFCFAAQVVLIIFACLGYKNRGVTGGLV